MNSHDYNNYDFSSSQGSSGLQIGMRGPPQSENMLYNSSRAYAAGASSSDQNLMPSIATPIQKTSYVRPYLIVPGLLHIGKNCMMVTETISARRTSFTWKFFKDVGLYPSIRIFYHSLVDGTPFCSLSIFLWDFSAVSSNRKRKYRIKSWVTLLIDVPLQSGNNIVSLSCNVGQRPSTWKSYQMFDYLLPHKTDLRKS